jgi:hypothetical protein
MPASNVLVDVYHLSPQLQRLPPRTHRRSSERQLPRTSRLWQNSTDSLLPHSRRGFNVFSCSRPIMLCRNLEHVGRYLGASISVRMPCHRKIPRNWRHGRRAWFLVSIHAQVISTERSRGGCIGIFVSLLLLDECTMRTRLHRYVDVSIPSA